MPLNVDLLLKLVLSLIMLSVGLSLKLKDFEYVRKNKNLVLIGLLIKLLIIPALGFLLLELTTLPLMLKFGVIILLVTPGGTTSNILTYWFGGTSTLTILLTTLSSFICILSIPVFVNGFSWYYFGNGSAFSLPVQDTFINIFFIILLPSFIGLFINEKHPLFAVKAEQLIKPISILLLGLVYLIKLFGSRDIGGSLINWEDVYLLLPVLIVINLLGLLVGFLIPKFLGKNNNDNMTIGIEMGIQNPALAILIGGTLLSNQELVKPALIYALFSFWTTAAFGYFVKD